MSIIKNRIILFYFGLTRKRETEDIHAISDSLDELLNLLKLLLYECDDTIEIEIYVSYFILLYKLIAYTRDINDGKGEKDLAYIMIDIWYKHFPILAKNMLETIPEKYGSWKDLKYFCKYTKHEECIDYCIELWNNQLEKDLEKDQNQDPDQSISYVSKWIPREKSAFGWLFEKSALEWQTRRYSPFPKKEYRHILSNLNRKINTPQIKETQGKWSEIIPQQTSVTTRSKQYHTFINTNRNENRERTQCQSNFEYYFTLPKSEEEEEEEIYSNKSFHLGEYIKNPHFQNEKYWNEIKKDILQHTNRQSPIYLLPIINISLSIQIIEDAIGIGCMISEISAMKNRIIVYNQQASCLNLTGLDLKTKIMKIKERCIVEGKSNLLNAISFIQKTETLNIIPVIISDFSTENNYVTPLLHSKMIYWNIGSKPPKPPKPQNQHIYVSGTSSSILKYIYQNIETIIDSYSFINNLVNQPRYIKVEEFFQKRIMEEDTTN